MSAEKGPSENDARTDQAALVGTGLGALIAVALSEGLWDAIDTAAGIALICVLAGYYRVVAPENVLDRLTKAVAFGAVGSLSGSVALAWPLEFDRQPRWHFLVLWAILAVALAATWFSIATWRITRKRRATSEAKAAAWGEKADNTNDAENLVETSLSVEDAGASKRESAGPIEGSSEIGDLQSVSDPGLR